MMSVRVFMTKFVIFFAAIIASIGAEVTVQPTAKPNDCICKLEDKVCACTFVIEHKLTMILEKEKQLVYPDNGVLRLRGKANRNAQLTPEQVSRVITADGATSRLVIAINGSFPGPRIEVWESQTLEITFINALHTDSVTMHFHGLHQRESPWMDGVAFVTQCPILPGQSFVHRFKAYPPGTAMYHAHIGDQRSMGLYGPVIVRPTKNPVIEDNEIIISLQDWNHLMDPEVAYQRMITEQFDFKTNEKINTTYSVDNGQFSRFEFQSGLANGKGRFWNTRNNNNGSPLERFKVRSGTLYRFRIIGAMTLYPMRVYIYGHRLTLRTSDAYNVDRIPVQSIIVHPGERYDFFWQAPPAINVTSKEILFIAETIETGQSLGFSKYHAAEAILEFEDSPKPPPPPNPPNSREETCTSSSKCTTFNCPYEFYPPNDNRVCITFAEVNNTDPNQNYKEVLGNKVDEEFFFNFAFPGPPDNTPGSVNGREFVPPTVSLLTQENELTTPCTDDCNKNGICQCTYIQKLKSNKLVQFVLLNLGSGSGWSHPVHLHGHSFYVMKMGFGTYNRNTGNLMSNSKDINCTDRFGYCSSAAWTNRSWAGGRVPDMSSKPPQKDTIVVPTGGYVVIRFRSDNPGMWFLHCHIDLHNTNGMGMVIDEGESKASPPAGFPTCRSFLYNGKSPDGSGVNSATKHSGFPIIVTFVFCLIIKIAT
ncbi:uncharacterized protein LOC132737186 isoform X1 [Ruditapes philippinarum]|uniref:uncharacterized protein LOC132737186 isoform X1 n=2 Tax=Ruditapes philippinarum TaxID=129788 RepID=UPI00295BC7D5|nr:uncharacterized protein LOC132737186 isoform X1 [Ruditapes philippinarum]